MHASSPATDASPAEVARELATVVRQILGSTRQVYRLLDELDLSLTHVKTLCVAAEWTGERDLSVKELGEELGMSLPNASRTVDHLLQRGYLERRADERDRRIKRVAITPAGGEVAHRIDHARLEGIEVWAAALSPEQRRALLDALNLLTKERA